MDINGPTVEAGREAFMTLAKAMVASQQISQEDAARAALYAAIWLMTPLHPQGEAATAFWLRQAADTLDTSGIDAEGQTRN